MGKMIYQDIMWPEDLQLYALGRNGRVKNVGINISGTWYGSMKPESACEC